MFSDFNWRNIWFTPETGRFRSGWRVAIYLLLASTLSGMLKEFFDLLLKIRPLPFPVTPSIDFAIRDFCGFLAAFAVGVWALRVLELLPPRALGVSLEKNTTRRFFFGIAAGMALILCYCVLAFFSGSLSWELISIPSKQLLYLALALTLYLIVAFFEELLFRGYYFQTCLRAFGLLPTLLVSSIIFAAAHANNSSISLIGYANIGIVGIFLALLYLRSGSLWAPIGFHFGWNFAQVLFGFKVSGMSSIFTSPFNALPQNHPWSALLAGDGFGPEGGIICSAILLAAVAVAARGPWGISLDDEWWRWPDAQIKAKKPPVWDFTIGHSYFQWKLPADRRDD